MVKTRSGSKRKSQSNIPNPSPKPKQAKQELPDGDSEVKRLFEETAGDDNHIDEREWIDLCLTKLRMNLETTELKRVFDQVDKNGSGTIDWQEFSEGMEHFGFLKSVASAYAATKAVSFSVPSSYNYEESTSDNYKAPLEEGFAPTFADIRKTRDYSYHDNYTMERQKWQDSVISTIAQRNHPQVLPWVVFTCGGMGAGKGYVLSWMSQNRYFPLEQIVHVDPDHFKAVMPEWDGYVAHNRDKAGSRCQKESGFLGEIAQEVAMRNSQHVWIDGSLRDGKWYAKVFDDLHRRFPDYRIAIFYISASPEIVRQRVAQRAAATGRDVPESLIEDSLNAPKETLALLVSKADFLARINNDSHPPKLEAFEVIDRSGSFNLIRNQFATAQPPPNRFPQSLAPLTVKKCNKSLYTRISSSDSAITIHSSVIAASPKLAAIKDRLCVDGKWTLRISPHHIVTLGQKLRDEVMIPTEARAFAWVYPSLLPATKAKAKPAAKAAKGTSEQPSSKRSKVSAKADTKPKEGNKAKADDKADDKPALDNDDDSDDEGLDTSDPDVSLAVNGGFAYFDSADKVIRLHAIMGFALDWRERKAKLATVPAAESSGDKAESDEAMLQFESAVVLPANTLDSLKPSLAPVTWHKITECTGLSKLQMTWVHPSQKLGKKKYTKGGGFVFALPADPNGAGANAGANANANAGAGASAGAGGDSKPQRFPVLFELASC